MYLGSMPQRFDSRCKASNTNAAERPDGLLRAPAGRHKALDAPSPWPGIPGARHELGAALQGHWRTLAFLDSAQLTVDKNPWEAGQNTANLSGAGLGLNWTGRIG
jgi:hypothetical protein